MKRSPLNPMSAKRRAALEAAGVFPTSTLARVARPALAVASLVVRRPRFTGPDAATVEAMRQRDGFQCVRCGGACHGERGRDWSAQHRRARGSGGSSRPDTNRLQNLILLCGSATTGCHGWVESHKAEAERHGWVVWQAGDPLLKPVDHFLHGLVWLTEDGNWSSRRPSAAGAA
ncbi:HNH endonuclease [Phytohabitans houttuyneae]|uniref:HNH endonuclease n=1 Tax=Phytohabitans houttuyneae TaxID=1076126 RepID=A0A6V8K320_9ACTN|nr:hypothetical protein [Phytohabitans houttuyneae]GFJ79543.1 hypothetical protein Phou_037230 [Phytohabitans houttuyneae]